MIWIAINRNTKEIVAQGSLIDCMEAATDDHFVSLLTSKEFWGAWYREGFWKGGK